MSGRKRTFSEMEGLPFKSSSSYLEMNKVEDED